MVQGDLATTRTDGRPCRYPRDADFVGMQDATVMETYTYISEDSLEA